MGEWERIVGKEGEEGIRTVWVMGALTAAVEAGIARPKVKEGKRKILLIYFVASDLKNHEADSCFLV